MASPAINPQTGEPQNPSGWSTDGSDSPLSPQSVLAKGAKTVGKMEQNIEDAEKTFAEKESKLGPLREKVIKDIMTPAQAQLHLEKAKEAPKPEDYQKFSMEFMQAATLLGAIAGKRSRLAGIASLNAFAAALKGWKEGNQQAYDNAAHQWEQETKKTLENNRVELEKYEAIIRDKQLNITQMMAALNIASVPFDNKIMFDATKNQNWGMVLAQIDKLSSIQEKLQNSFNTGSGFINEARERTRTVIEDLNAHPERAANMKYEDYLKWKGNAEMLHQNDPSFPLLNELPQGQGFVAPAGRSGRSPEDAKQIVQAMKNGDQPPLTTGLYGMGPLVKAEAERQGFNIAQAQLEWRAAEKQILSLNGPQMTRFVGLARGVQNTIDEVKRLAERMQLGGIPALNAAELQGYIQTQGNSANGRLATNYMTAVNTLKEEFANLANGGYAPTEPAWKLADQQINGNYGVYQLSDSLDEVRRLIGYRLHSMPGMDRLGPGAPNRYTGETGTPALPAEGEGPARGGRAAPEPGTVMDGYRFKGGDPSKQENWEQVM